jgi:hypothetical protein
MKWRRMCDETKSDQAVILASFEVARPRELLAITLEETRESIVALCQRDLPREDEKEYGRPPANDH